jgi:hypothetical protein
LIDVVWKEEGLRLVRGIVFDDEEEGVLLLVITSVLDVYVCVCDVVSCPTALKVFSYEICWWRRGTTVYFMIVTFSRVMRL